MKWTDELPTEVGWYWQRRQTGPEKGEVRIVKVRMFVNKLAIFNSNIDSMDKKTYEWAGPIPEPEEYR